MAYLKKMLTSADWDMMRISLSVYEKKLGLEPHCDFCGDTDPLYTYASNVMSTGEQTQCWRWCACESCSEAVDTDNWPSVEIKLEKWLRPRIEALGFPVSSKVLRAAAKEALKQFHDNCVTTNIGGQL